MLILTCADAIGAIAVAAPPATAIVASNASLRGRTQHLRHDRPDFGLDREGNHGSGNSAGFDANSAKLGGLVLTCVM